MQLDNIMKDIRNIEFDTNIINGNLFEYFLLLNFYLGGPDQSLDRPSTSH